MSIQKKYCSQSRKSLFATLGWSFFIKVSFCLYTSLIRLLLLWISSAASSLLITEVAVETYIFSMFFIFGKISFAYFKFIYFGISKVISSMEGDEGVIFRKAKAWKSLFLLKIKSKTQTRQKRHIMQSSCTFIRISGLPEVKKFCIDQWLGKGSCILERIQAKQSVFMLCSRYCWGDLGSSTTPENFEHFFFLEIRQFNSILRPSVSPTNILYLKGYTPNFRTLLWIPRLISKKINTQKSQFWIYGWIRKSHKAVHISNVA